MNAGLQAGAFLAAHQAGWRPEVALSERTLRAADRELSADVYRPRGRSRTRSTVVFVHGYTARANRDPRIVDFCRRLTLFDATIVAPRFDEIADYVIDGRCVAAIEAALAAIAADDELTPSGRTGVFCASLASTFCLAAAGRPAVAPRVSAICLAGGCYSVPGTLGILFRQDEKPYGRDILLLHHLERIAGPRPRVAEALRAALLDNSLERNPRELPGLLERMTVDDRTLFLELRGKPEFRKSFIGCIQPELERLGRECGPLDGLCAPVVLLHGEDDRLIPASESVDLAAELQRRNKQVRLDVSPLIGHMEATAIRPRLFGALARLVGSFATFFRQASA